MSRRVSELSNDVTVYLVLNDFRTGLAYLETAADEADRETVIRNFIGGQYSDALRVIAFNTAEGWSRDVSEDIARGARSRRRRRRDAHRRHEAVHRPASHPRREAAAGAVGAA
jgi:hypothetical protein